MTTHRLPPSWTIARRATALSWGMALLLLTSVGAAQERPTPDKAAINPERAEASESTLPEKHYFRAGFERLGLLGIGEAWYWANKSVNGVDWDLRWDRESWKQKLITFEAVRLDNNAFNTNALGHALAGTGYHLVSRGNRLEVWESFLFDVAASVLWEYFGEFREKVSLNDLVLTPIAGLAIGETLHNFSVLFSRAQPAFSYRALAWGLNPFQAVHDQVDGRPWQTASRLDKWGMPRDPWHRFVLAAGHSYAISGAGDDVHAIDLSLNAELLHPTGFMKRGGGSSFFMDGGYYRLMTRGAVSVDGELQRFVFGARAAPLGYAWHQKRGGGPGLRGHGVLAALGPAYEYALHELPGHTDRLAIVHLPGPTVLWLAHMGRLRSRLTLNLFGDFSLVRSLGADLFLSSNRDATVRSVVMEQQYYYGLGWTVNPEWVLTLHGFEVGGFVKYQRWWSIDGLDRHQELADSDIMLNDSQFIWRAWAGVTVPGTPIALKISMANRTREGSIGPLSSHHRESMLISDLTLTF
jgi:hypothetical protein